MRSSRDLTIIKLGGSHAFSSDLPKWVDSIANQASPIVIVPGGGPFADTVRVAQPRMGFDDHAAHHMALLAMEQYGLALASLNKRLAPANSPAAVWRLLRERQVPVWLPARMVLAATDIPQSWDVTSDSLAAWLAGKLRAAQLLLVKHWEHAGPNVGVAELSSRGIVDPLFSRFLHSNGVAGFIAEPGDHAKLDALVRGDPAAGIRITLHEAQADEVESALWRRSIRRAGAGR